MSAGRRRPTLIKISEGAMDFVKLLYIDGMIAITLVFPSLLVAAAVFTHVGRQRA